MSSKINDSAATSIKGSIVLVIGNTIAMMANAVGVILVARMLLPADYGLFTITLILPGIFYLLTGWGINPPLIRLIARRRANTTEINEKNLIFTTYLFRILLGGSLTLILFFMSDFLAASVLKKPEVGSYVRIASILVISEIIFQTNNAVFAGYEKMTTRAALNICQSLIKGIFSPLLVYIGMGVSVVVIAHTSSYLEAGLIGLILVIKQTNISKRPEPTTSFKQTLKILLTFGFPLFLSQIFLRASVHIRGLLLSWYISSDIIGNYGVANWFNLLLFTITNSIGVALFPAFSKYEFQSEPTQLRDIYRGSTRYSTIFIIPLTMLIITSSESIIQFLFNTKYPHAPTFLILLLLPNLFIGLGRISIRRLLISQGENRATLVLDSINSIITIILAYTFIQIWSVNGLLISLVISALSHCLIGSYIIYTKFGITHNITHEIQTLLSAGFSGLITKNIVDSLNIANPFITIIISTILFLTTYIITAPLTGAIQKRDITNLDNMLRNIKPLYPLTKTVLIVIEKIITLRTRKSE